MSLSIIVPLYAIRHAQIGGTEFAIYNLLKGIAETEAALTVSYGRRSDLSPEFLTWVNAHRQIKSFCTGGIPGPKNVRFAEELAFEARTSLDDWALYPNYFCPPKIRNSSRRRSVILHDIQYRVYPEYHSNKRRAWLDFYLPRMFRSADSVILISKSEHELVYKHFGTRAADRCDVVYNAIDWERFTPKPGQVVGLELTNRIARPYILSVCHHFPHKNLTTLLQAFSRISEVNKDIQLYLVGKPSKANADFIQQSVSEAATARIRLIGFVSDFELGIYYKNASVFAMPSLYEGFGMPAVEAMGLGIPTIVSRAHALPEVTLGKAEYVDNPLDVGEWTTRLLDMLRSGSVSPPNTIAEIRAAFSPPKAGHSLLDFLRARS